MLSGRQLDDAPAIRCLRAPRIYGDQQFAARKLSDVADPSDVRQDDLCHIGGGIVTQQVLRSESAKQERAVPGGELATLDKEEPRWCNPIVRPPELRRQD